MATVSKNFKVKNGLEAGSTIFSAASTTAAASLNIPHGTAPTSPANGDFWTTSSGAYVRINGVTVGPLASSAGSGTPWGTITGTLSSQTDLQTALDAKLNLSGGTLTGSLTLPGTAGTRNLLMSSGYAVLGLVTIGRSGSGYGTIGDGYRTTSLANSYNYERNDYATMLSFSSGAFSFQTSALGTAGNPVTFAERFFINNAGDISNARDATIGRNLTVTGTTILLSATSGSPSVNISGVAGTFRGLQFKTAGVRRWTMYANADAESGSDVGSDFALYRANDAGSETRVMYIQRSTGNVTFDSATTLTGDLTISKATPTLKVSSSSGSSVVSIEGVAGTARSLYFKTGSLARWSIDGNTTAESGSNAGSDLNIFRYNDAGTAIGSVLSISRSDGGFTFAGNMTQVMPSAFMTLLSSTGPSALYLMANAGQNRSLYMLSGDGTTRWDIRSNSTTESGSNVGSDLDIYRYSDAGASQGIALSIKRSTGAATFQNAVIGGTSLVGQKQSGYAVQYHDLATLNGGNLTPGAWVLTTPIPRAGTHMVKIHVHGFQYANSVIDFEVHFYTYSANGPDGVPGQIYTPILIDKGNDGLPKYAGAKDGYVVLAIGDTTSSIAYPKLNVDALITHNSATGFESGWSWATTPNTTANFGWAYAPVNLTQYGQIVTLNSQTFPGIKTFSNTTDSSASTNGAVIVSGGLGVAKKLYVGTNLNVAGTTTLTGVVTLGSTSSAPTLGSELGDGINMNQTVTTVIGARYYVSATTLTACTISPAGAAGETTLNIGSNNTSFVATATSHTLTGTGTGFLSVKAITAANAAGGTLAGQQFRSYNTGNFGIGTSTLQYTFGPYNSALGEQALYQNITGFGNQALGYFALGNNTAGYYNAAVGYASQQVNKTGAFNTSVGYYSLGGVIAGNYNVGIGAYAGNSATGSWNMLAGTRAGYSLTSGQFNTFVGGHHTGRAFTTGSYNLALGTYAGYTGSSAGVSGTVTIGTDSSGTGAQVTADNTIVLGTSSHNTLVAGTSAFTGQMSLVNGTPTTLKFAKAVQYGYSSSYRAIVLGDPATTPNNVTVSIGYDPSTNASGSFTGDGREVLFRNAAEFMTPNSGNTSFIKPLKWDSSGNTTLLGLTAGTTSLSGDLTISKGTATFNITSTSGDAYARISRLAGNGGYYEVHTNGVRRWVLGADTASESGSNAGSNFALYSYTDAGALAATAIHVNRSTSAVTLAGGLTVSGNIAVTKDTPIITINGSGYANPAYYNVYRAAGQFGGMLLSTGSTSRWLVAVNNTSESGSDAGSDFVVKRYSDAGAGLGDALTITRSTGNATFSGSITATSFSGTAVLSGTPTAPTAAVDTNTTQIATTAYVIGQGYLKSATASSTYAPIASPTFTGTVTTPGVKRNVVTKSALYTLTASDHIVIATSGTWTATLPTAASIAGTEYIIKNSGSGIITVDPAGTETIDGSTTIDLAQYDSLTVVSDGTNWVIV